MKNLSPKSIIIKVTIVHTISYFAVGLLFYTFLDYKSVYSDPSIAVYLRPTDSPIVALGTALQAVRGILFGIVIYYLRTVFFVERSGWLLMWLTLCVIGVFSTFGSAPGSIEGLIYTVLPIWFHLFYLPEIIIQPFLLSYFSVLWVHHPDHKIANWITGIFFTVIVFLSVLGYLSHYIVK